MSTNEKFLGIEIGGTKLQLSVANSSVSIEQNFRYTIDASKGALHIQNQIEGGLNKLKHYNKIAAIGVGFGGPVDWKTGAIRVSHQVSGWDDFNLLLWLQQQTKRPVVIDNDANVAALAEAVYGRGKGFARVFYITIGSGIGGGMIIDREIYHGRIPGELEVGHLLMNKKGVTLESRCSGWAVDKRIKAFIRKNPGSMLAELAANNVRPLASLLKPAIEEKDAASKKIAEEIGDDLAFSLSHVVHLFHPDIIVIGGGLSLLKDHLRFPVLEKLPQYVMKAFLPIPQIEIAALGESAVPAGALELARRHWLQLNTLDTLEHYQTKL